MKTVLTSAPPERVLETPKGPQTTLRTDELRIWSHEPQAWVWIWNLKKKFMAIFDVQVPFALLSE